MYRNYVKDIQKLVERCTSFIKTKRLLLKNKTNETKNRILPSNFSLRNRFKFYHFDKYLELKIELGFYDYNNSKTNVFNMYLSKKSLLKIKSAFDDL